VEEIVSNCWGTIGNLSHLVEKKNNVNDTVKTWEGYKQRGTLKRQKGMGRNV